MGHVQSKRKRERKRRKITQLSEIMKTMTAISADTDNIHKVADHRIYRDSSTTDQLSNSSGYFSSNEPSPHSPGKEDLGWNHGSEDLFDMPEDKCSNSLGMSALEELYTYKGLPIDDHPALTNLQNEQNLRLEIMEQRMSRIRTSAQKAYDRKKFAHIFRAKKVDSRTDDLLKGAREVFEHNADVQNSRPAVQNNNDYSGEIIPVHYLEEEEEKVETEDESYLPLSSFGSLKFSEPVMILILPFLLPLFIIVAVIRGLSEMFGWKEGRWKPKSRRNSS